jgi:DNA-binding protein HU-beta
MTKAELIDAVAKKSSLTKKNAGAAVSAVIDSISEALASHHKVQLVGFGTFEVRRRAAREGRNPQDPTKKIKIPARDIPAFKPGKALKDKVHPNSNKKH